MAGKEISGPAFFVGVVVGLPSYMTEPFRKSGLRFRILPFAYGLLLMQNSHLSVLRQATPQSLERVESWKPRHIFITGSVYNSAAIYSFQKGRCGYSHIPCHLNHIGEGAVGRWKMVGSAKRCGVVLRPRFVVEQVNIQAGAILLPGVNTSLNFRRSGEHSFDFRSMSEHRQVRVYGESR